MVSAPGSGAELYRPFSECSPTAKGSEECMNMKNMNNKKVFSRFDIDVYPGLSGEEVLGKIQEIPVIVVSTKAGIAGKDRSSLGK